MAQLCYDAGMTSSSEELVNRAVLDMTPKEMCGLIAAAHQNGVRSKT